MIVTDAEVVENSDVNDAHQDNHHGENHQDISKTTTLRFGYFGYTPQFLQRFNRPRWLLLVLAIYFVVGSMQVVGLRAVVIRPLERRFNLTSTQAGLIVSVNEISASFAAAFLTFFATQGHKGQWLGYGALTFAGGSILFSSPQYMTGKYFYPDLTNESDLCKLSLSNSSSINTCLQQKVYSSALYIAVFIIAQIINGFGAASVYSVSIAYADENVSPRSSPVYVGIINAMGALGPAVGFLLGGLLLNIYVDWPYTPPDLTPSDPRWIGAWWLGYVITGILFFVIAIPLLGFPKHLPNYERYRAERKALPSAKEDAEFGTRLSEFPKAIFQLFVNKVYICTVLGFSCEEVIISGLSSFLPKYIDSQFALGLSTSVLIAGAVTVVGGFGGIIVGGVLMKYFNLYGIKTVKYCTIVSFIGVLLGLGLLIKCDNPPFAGINIPYNKNITSSFNTQMTANITAHCNYPCHCHSIKYNPVCGSDGKTYFSPCHAGCKDRQLNPTTNILEYYNCECINTNTEYEKATASVPFRSAYSNACSGDCHLSTTFFIALAFIMISTFLNVAPGIQLILRSVPENQNAFAMGLFGAIARLVGGMIGPVIFGVILDSSCSLWDESCDQRGFCWTYNNNTLSLLVVATVTAFKVGKFLFYSMAWYFHPSSEQADGANDEKKVKLQNNRSEINSSLFSKANHVVARETAV